MKTDEEKTNDKPESKPKKKNKSRRRAKAVKLAKEAAAAGISIFFLKNLFYFNGDELA